MPEDDISGGRGTAGASYGLQSDVKMNLPGLEEATKQITAMTSALGELSESLKGMSNNSGQLTSGMNAIASSAQQMGFQAPRNYDPSQLVSGMGSTDVSWLGNLGKSGLAGAAGAIVSAPVTYAFNRVEQNRMVTRALSADLGRVSTMSGTGIEGILSMLAKGTPVLGAPEEITGVMNQGATQGYANMNSARSGAYYTGVRQMQQFTPGLDPVGIAGLSSAYLGNTKAQQAGMMLTGGATSSFGAGGVPKTLQEWAEGILRWFEGQRPGQDRGKPFTKEELSTQFFPGSNMSAWMTTTGVPDYMQDYFWQYAMGKVQATGTSGGAVTMDQIMGQRGGDLALANKVTQTAGARRDFGFASEPGMIGGQSFYQAYLTRENADQWFANVMAEFERKIAGWLGGFADLIAKLPTPVAAFAEGLFSQGAPAAAQAIQSTLSGLSSGAGDPEFGIGDAGYGPMGGTNTAGLTPDMARRVNNMRKANPRLQIASGFRDGATQDRLHRKGIGMTAPMGKSQHGRGLAADLGPSSEYGWIAANAGKFGLASGKNHGEPWHVGFPGTLPGKNFMVGDIKDLFGDITSAMNPANWWEGVTSIGSSVFDALASGASDIWGTIKNFGGSLFQGAASMLKGDFSALYGEGGPFNQADLQQQGVSGLFNLMGIPSLLNPFALLSGEAGSGATAKDFSAAFGSLLGSGTGGLIRPNLTSSMDWSNMAGSGGGAPGAGSAGGGGPSGTPGVSGGVAAILQKYGGGKNINAASVAGKEQAIRTTLDAAMKAGFSGDELVAMGALAGRESGWNPASHNPNRSTGDDSYGLWQINMLGSMGPSRRQQFGISSNTDLLDPFVSGRAAFSLSSNGTDFSPWGGYKGKEMLYNAQQYVQPVYDLAKQWGFVGDPGYAPAYAPFPGAGGTNVVVQNAITIAGGGTSPIGLRRTAEQLAGYTTDEIRKQLARST